jgi:hypothetical protein
MMPASREWLAGLRDRVDSVRRAAAPAGHAGSPAALAAERMILAAHLRTWLENELPTLLAERPDPAAPAIAITTTPLGVEVVESMLAAGGPAIEGRRVRAGDLDPRDEPLMRSLRDRVAAVTEAEYRGWTMGHPDLDHLLHVNHWSWVKTRVPQVRWPEFAAFPLGPGEQYWLHRTGTAGCGAERRHCHLWKFTGSSAVMLRPFIVEGVRGM